MPVWSPAQNQIYRADVEIAFFCWFDRGGIRGVCDAALGRKSVDTQCED
jgi:hypothetical protein